MSALWRWLARLPRLARVLWVFVTAVMVVLVLSPLVDRIYIEHFFDEATVIVPSYISVFFGALAYLWGWVSWVGAAGEREIVPTRSGQVFAVFAFCVMVIGIGLLLHGFSMTDFIAG